MNFSHITLSNAVVNTKMIKKFAITISSFLYNQSFYIAAKQTNISNDKSVIIVLID